MDVPFEKNKEFIQTLIVILERIRMENGCICCDFLKDVGVENKYRLMGKWKKHNDLQNYLESEEFSILRGAMILLKNKPKICVHVVSSTKGLDPGHKGLALHKTNNLRI